MFEAILQAIAAHERIILHRHTHPDGDALGSQIGLKHLLRENFPGKQVYMVGDGAGRYDFMEDSVMDDVPDEAYRDAMAIILDTSAPGLISDGRYALAKTTARIDHHLFTGQIAQLEAIDTGSESCCGLIVRLAMEHGLRLTPVAAQSLFIGMVTDSGRFRYDATSARTFRQAAWLLEQQPLDVSGIYRNLYASDFDQVRLRAQFVLNIRFTPHRVAYLYTTGEELRAQGLDPFVISRAMVNTMADIRGVDVWVSFTESEEGVLCELRSDRRNINPVAVQYGGGGHAKASGARVKDRAEAMAMLADLDAMMEEG
ncbi:MAG: bifunctional oligoribonuclease/PAP phosphatase NrnA [Christensenellales bacterium]|jgi:phosphoesterase RecJ-like protein|uniref:Bifunctional oligoribonuclease/PAP phosphatase NrnA n=1 Tax=Candidatus Avichristensenella intestinipullorum TaxID=2840693 RepID=A0A9D1CI70_9FIRM|nr:bifunctional oligoribonuclease/PAP phosphatase NrnA [Christensenellales bacterium]HIQ62480.1 bifunctional oligoribonuclease/PAP phosphatase NrnA [Candidatus Avichristensenella intestinipullorum]